MTRSQPADRSAAARQPGALVARILAVPALAADTALAAALVVLLFNIAVSGTEQEAAGDTALLVAGAAVIALRRRWPLAVLAATLIPYVVTPHTGPAQAPVLVALYTVVTLRPQRTATVATALAALASVAAVAAHGDTTAVAIGRVLAVAVVALVGLVAAERRRQHEREARMLAHIAATDERIRIARELHDVVAHHLSVIVVQANLAAETLTSEQPAFVPTRAVVAAGREALADTRRVLGVLRTDNGPDDRAPQPGLAALDELLERIRATGLDVQLTTRGDAAPLPAALDLCAYRIIQEALTNTLRHAHAEHARISVEYAPRALTLEVIDDGTVQDKDGPTAAGHGLGGMRERAAAFGGALTAGPDPNGGYVVQATLPR